MDSFTEAEKKLLLRYCSNVDKPIFALQNLPESVKGALFSRYSRSTKGLRRLLLDEFIQNPELNFAEIANTIPLSQEDTVVAKEKADAFYARVLDGYGDDSVGELGGAHIAIEGVSNLATKVLEDSRLGGSPLEKSSRYVFFDQKENGEYRFYKEPVLMASPFAAEYLRVMNLLFDTYSKLVEPLTAFFEKRYPIESFPFMVDYSTKEEKKFSEIQDPKIQERARTAYKASIRAKTCDCLRYLLPVSTLTNVGIFGNGRFFEYLLRKLYSHPLKEMQLLAEQMHKELNCTIAPFVKRANPDEYIQNRQREASDAVSVHTADRALSSTPPVVLVEFDRDAEEKIVSRGLFEHSAFSLSQCQQLVARMSTEEKEKLLRVFLGKRKTRRDKPPRSFESTYYTFDLLGDYGMYRDLHRHRVLTQQRQLISCLHGFEVPEEIKDAGFENEFVPALKEAEALYFKIAKQYPFEAQYVVPFAFRIRWYMTMNLREAFHFIELRSGKQGHSSYRKMTQEMYYALEKVHPSLAHAMQFVDLNTHTLARLDAEMRTQNKRAQREKEK